MSCASRVYWVVLYSLLTLPVILTPVFHVCIQVAISTIVRNFGFSGCPGSSSRHDFFFRKKKETKHREGVIHTCFITSRLSLCVLFAVCSRRVYSLYSPFCLWTVVFHPLVSVMMIHSTWEMTYTFLCKVRWHEKPFERTQRQRALCCGNSFKTLFTCLFSLKFCDSITQFTSCCRCSISFYDKFYTSVQKNRLMDRSRPNLQKVQKVSPQIREVHF